MPRDNVLINKNSGNKTWLTPPYIIKALGGFDVDPCCPPNMPWRTAEVMYTEEQDGLVQPWTGRVWLNPPYGKEAKPFLEKMIHYAKTMSGCGTALVFVRTETKLWQELIFPNAHAILFMRGRVKFYDCDGVEGDYATMPSALIAFSAYDAKRLEDAYKSKEIQGTLITKGYNL